MTLPLEDEVVSSRQTASESFDEKQIEPFRFLDLPSELRLRVYDFFLIYDDDITICRCSPRRPQDSYRLIALRCPHEGCRHFGANSRRNSSSFRYPIDLALLWTCRLVHNEAAHTLYSMNTFGFDSEGGFLNFVLFSQRLTNRQSLRNLTFHPIEIFDSQRQANYALSEWAHAALKTINHLPDLRIMAFTAHTNLSLNSLTMITMICRALRDTQCSLTLERPKCEHAHARFGNFYFSHTMQSLPKIHHSVLATLVEFGWKVINDYEVIDTPGSVPQSCR